MIIVPEKLVVQKIPIGVSLQEIERGWTEDNRFSYA
jgi:hypothetical protein